MCTYVHYCVCWGGYHSINPYESAHGYVPYKHSFHYIIVLPVYMGTNMRQ